MNLPYIVPVALRDPYIRRHRFGERHLEGAVPFGLRDKFRRRHLHGALGEHPADLIAAFIEWVGDASLVRLIVRHDRRMVERCNSEQLACQRLPRLTGLLGAARELELQDHRVDDFELLLVIV